MTEAKISARLEKAMYVTCMYLGSLGVDQVRAAKSLEEYSAKHSGKVQVCHSLETSEGRGYLTSDEQKPPTDGRKRIFALCKRDARATKKFKADFLEDWMLLANSTNLSNLQGFSVAGRTLPRKAQKGTFEGGSFRSMSTEELNASSAAVITQAAPSASTGSSSSVGNTYTATSGNNGSGGNIFSLGAQDGTSASRGPVGKSTAGTSSSSGGNTSGSSLHNNDFNVHYTSGGKSLGDIPGVSSGIGVSAGIGGISVPTTAGKATGQFQSSSLRSVEALVQSVNQKSSSSKHGLNLGQANKPKQLKRTHDEAFSAGNGGGHLPDASSSTAIGSTSTGIGTSTTLESAAAGAKPALTQEQKDTIARNKEAALKKRAELRAAKAKAQK